MLASGKCTSNLVHAMWFRKKMEEECTEKECIALSAIHSSPNRLWWRRVESHNSHYYWLRVCVLCDVWYVFCALANCMQAGYQNHTKYNDLSRCESLWIGSFCCSCTRRKDANVMCVIYAISTLVSRLCGSTICPQRVPNYFFSRFCEHRGAECVDNILYYI